MALKVLTVSLVAAGINSNAEVLERPWLDGQSLINDDTWIQWLNHHNLNTNSTWTAGTNDFFNGMKFEDARALLGTQLLPIADHLGECLDASHYASIRDDDIPVSFSAMEKWPSLIHPIRDQQHCGSCWAFSASEVLSDRSALASGTASPVLSPEDLVSCDTGDMGCRGGQLPMAWKYLQETGIVSDKCFPYSAGNGTAATCSKTCADSESWEASKVKARSAYAINGVTNIQKELMTNGPIQVAFMVYKSFMSYKSGVYQKHFWELIPEGGHAVKLVGWGSENSTDASGQTQSTDYWLVANSWNTTWGQDGFFKILRGKDHCGIETMGPPYAGMPATDSLLVI